MNTVTIAKFAPASNNPRKGGAAGEIEICAMENCRQLESLQSASGSPLAAPDKQAAGTFDCKTCGRKFESFQALGGHRTSHKKDKTKISSEFPTAKPTTHRCKVCGEERPTGQALGGHMSKHRDVLFGNNKGGSIKKRMALMSSTSATSNVTSEGGSGNGDANNGRHDKEEVKPVCTNWGLTLWWTEEQLQEYNNNNTLNLRI